MTLLFPSKGGSSAGAAACCSSLSPGGAGMTCWVGLGPLPGVEAPSAVPEVTFQEALLSSGIWKTHCLACLPRDLGNRVQLFADLTVGKF